MSDKSDSTWLEGVQAMEKAEANLAEEEPTTDTYALLAIGHFLNDLCNEAGSLTDSLSRLAIAVEAIEGRYQGRK